MNAFAKPGMIGKPGGNAQYLVLGREKDWSHLQTTVGLGVKLGLSHPSIQGLVKSNIEYINGQAKRAQSVAGDVTRNTAQKHLFAAAVAGDVQREILKVRDIVAGKAKTLIEEGNDRVQSKLGPQDNTGYLQSEIRGWIRDQVKTPAGMQTVADAYKSDLQVASTVYSSPHFLLNVSEKLHDGWKAKAVEVFEPKGWNMILEGQAIEKLLPNYDATSKLFHTVAYNPEILAEAEAKRVE